VSSNEPGKRETVRIDIKKATENVRDLLKTPSRKPRSGLVPVTEAIPDEQESNRLFTELFESVYDAILFTGLDGRILRTNERAQELFLLSSEEFGHLQVTDLFSGADTGMLEWISMKLENKRRVFIECHCNRKDSMTFPAEVTVNSIHLTAASKGELCFYIRNVTVRKKTENALQEAQGNLLNAAHKAGMAEIATGVLHDVGNVLNSINVSCELISSNVRGPALGALGKVNGLLNEHAGDLTDFLTDDPKGSKTLEVLGFTEAALSEERDTILEETDRLMRKVGLLREVIGTQQDYARPGLFYQKVALRDVISDALALNQTRLSNHVIAVTVDCPEDITLTTQKTKLVYILINLVQNAVDALKARDDVDPGERRVRIVGSRADGDIALEIRDNGIGIPAENLTTIFNHGFTTKPGGHGFGLHTCANFIKEIGGEICAESAGAGEGSTFLIRLPVVGPNEKDGQNAE
jgi:PAS domain S-box-containing protein